MAFVKIVIAEESFLPQCTPSTSVEHKIIHVNSSVQNAQADIIGSKIALGKKRANTIEIKLERNLNEHQLNTRPPAGDYNRMHTSRLGRRGQGIDPNIKVVGVLATNKPNTFSMLRPP